MKRLFNPRKIEKACPVGSMTAETLTKLVDSVDALETKLAGVLSATASQSGKALVIGSDGNVKVAT